MRAGQDSYVTGVWNPAAFSMPATNPIDNLFHCTTMWSGQETSHSGNPHGGDEAMIEIKDLRTNASAPNFRLLATNGREVELVKYRQRQPVVLFFMHDANCEICRARLMAFADLYADFQNEKIALLVIVPG